MTTPSQHRTRLGPPGQPAGRVNTTDYRNSSSMMPNSSQNQTPSQRQPFSNISGNSVNRPSVSGYGMSAGMKVGRQQGSGKSHPRNQRVIANVCGSLTSRCCRARSIYQSLHASAGAVAIAAVPGKWCLLVIACQPGAEVACAFTADISIRRIVLISLLVNRVPKSPS